MKSLILTSAIAAALTTLGSISVQAQSRQTVLVTNSINGRGDSDITDLNTCAPLDAIVLHSLKHTVYLDRLILTYDNFQRDLLDINQTISPGSYSRRLDVRAAGCLRSVELIGRSQSIVGSSAIVEIIAIDDGRRGPPPPRDDRGGFDPRGPRHDDRGGFNPRGPRRDDRGGFNPRGPRRDDRGPRQDDGSGVQGSIGQAPQAPQQPAPPQAPGQPGPRDDRDPRDPRGPRR